MADSGMLAVSVVAQQRLALGTGSEVSFFTGTYPFVPGSVLRGALAAAWIAEHGPPTPGSSAQARFRDLFDGPVRYGPLYVPGSFVQPVSARRCKYPQDSACERAAVDAAFEPGLTCPECGGPAEPGKGQVVLPAGVTLDRITRTSINPRTGKAGDGELYAHGALPAGIRLTGVIHGRDPWLEKPRQFRLGGRRTVGGAADYTAGPVTQGAPSGTWDGSGPLVVRLTSPGVFVDVAGRPRLDPDPVLDLDGAAVERTWARPMTWPGWHAASALPKPEELCAVAGSTYLVNGSPGVLCALAERLPAEGAGLRRAEGFGGVQVVTGPRRPPPATAAAATEQGADAEARVRELHARIQDLDLNEDQHRWVVSAVRDLQLDRQRRVAAEPRATDDGEDLAALLLSQPAAQSLSGRQRDTLRAAFSESGPDVLRDLATLLASHGTGSAGGSVR